MIEKYIFDYHSFPVIFSSKTILISDWDFDIYDYYVHKADLTIYFRKDNTFYETPQKFAYKKDNFKVSRNTLSRPYAEYMQSICSPYRKNMTKGTNKKQWTKDPP